MDMENSDDISLPPQYRDAPVAALRVSVRENLSSWLNVKQGKLNDDGLFTNYLGLAEEIGFSFEEITSFSRANIDDPTSEILNAWIKRSDLDPTVGNLVQYLKTLNRVDLIAKCKGNLIRDIQHYHKKSRSNGKVQDGTIDSQSADSSEGMQDYTDHNVDEYRYMTVQDVQNNQPTYYDAFVSFNPEGYDLEFVKKMLSELETTYGLKMFVPCRDDLPGASSHTVVAKLIQDRCRKMVVIMSPRFLKSPSCDFQMKFAQSLSPGSRDKKIVPVQIAPCTTPPILNHVNSCDFTNQESWESFWGRLAVAIKAPRTLEESPTSSSACLDDFTLYDRGPDGSIQSPPEMRYSTWQASNSQVASSYDSSPLPSMEQSPGETSNLLSSMTSVKGFISAQNSRPGHASSLDPTPPRPRPSSISQLFPSCQF